MKTYDVVWMDAGHKTGWSHVNEVTAWMEDERMFTCHNVGLLMAEDDDAVVLCGGESGSNMWSPIRIMKRTIISMKELSYA